GVDDGEAVGDAGAEAGVGVAEVVGLVVAVGDDDAVGVVAHDGGAAEIAHVVFRVANVGAVGGAGGDGAGLPGAVFVAEDDHVLAAVVAGAGFGRPPGGGHGIAGRVEAG